MCSYNIILDDQLVAEAAHTLKGVSMETWIQQQVESLLKERLAQSANHSTAKRIVKRRAEHIPSDSQLETLFIGKDMPVMPDDSSWEEIISAKMGKTIKSMEKWL